MLCSVGTQSNIQEEDGKAPSTPEGVLFQSEPRELTPSPLSLFSSVLSVRLPQPHLPMSLCFGLGFLPENSTTIISLSSLWVGRHFLAYIRHIYLLDNTPAHLYSYSFLHLIHIFLFSFNPSKSGNPHSIYYRQLSFLPPLFLSLFFFFCTKQQYIQ